MHLTDTHLAQKCPIFPTSLLVWQLRSFGESHKRFTIDPAEMFCLLKNEHEGLECGTLLRKALEQLGILGESATATAVRTHREDKSRDRDASSRVLPHPDLRGQLP